MLSDELVRLMKKAGCYQIDLGVEVGIEPIMKDYKQLTKELIEGRMKEMKRIGMETRLFFIIGPPAKTKEDVEQTIKYAIQLDPDYALFTPASPFPGTQLLDQLEKGRYDVPDFETKVFIDSEAICDLPNFRKEYLNFMVKIAYQRFYMRPKYIFKKLFSIRSYYNLRTLLNGFLPLLSFVMKKR